MPARHVLLLDHRGLTVWARQRSAMQVAANFPGDTSGVDDFGRWLAAQPGRLHCRLLVDLAEEAYEYDVLPRTRGADRRALLQRHLARHFMGASLTTIVPQGCANGNRHQEGVLMSALTRPALVTPWLDQLTAQGARIDGVHTIPLVLDQLVRRLARRHPRLRQPHVLITVTPAGERHSFFEQRRLRFSRLIAADEANALPRTLTHLDARKMLDRQDKPDIVVLGPTDLAARLAVDLPSRTDAATGLQIHHIAATTDATALLSRLLQTAAHSPAHADYAPAPIRAASRHDRLVRRITGGGMIMGAVSGAFAIGLWVTSQALNTRLAQLDAEAARLTQAYQAQLAELPPLPASAADLRTLLAAHTRHRALHADSLPLLHVLGGALDAHPDATLHSLTWQRTDDSAHALVLHADLDLPASVAHALNHYLAGHHTIQLRTLRTSTPAALSRAGDPPSGPHQRIRLELRAIEPADKQT